MLVALAIAETLAARRVARKIATRMLRMYDGAGTRPVPAFNVLKINSHRYGARNFLPANMLPESCPALVIVGHHDDNTFDPSLAQAIQALVQQTLAKSGSLIGRINRQMVNVPAASIIPA